MMGRLAEGVEEEIEMEVGVEDGNSVSCRSRRRI